MTLTEYKRKRNFKRTPEPSGGVANGVAHHQFVIQKHAASRLHYDFRLELDGTLKSWAVPKGPSLDPDVKSLAVQVEDHPLAYASFEGVIPQGEYGGGTVMVWDRGTWQPTSDARAGLKKGKLTFELFGEKLRGSWSLVQMHGKAGDGGKNWLLMKRDDQEAKSGRKAQIVDTAAESVVSDRDIDEIASDADNVWTKRGATKSNGRKPRTLSKSASKKTRIRGQALAPAATNLAKLSGARRAALPKSFRPQLATLSDKMPTGDNWLHELKFDGYRIVAFLKNGRVRLMSRNDNDWTHRFPTIVKKLKKVPLKQAILDGEIVALDPDGKSNFQRLQSALREGESTELIYYVFDIPHLEEYDLTSVPLIDRKEQLQKVLLTGGRANNGQLRYSDHIQGNGDKVWQRACQSAMEGIVSKRADSFYAQARTRDWLKIKCLQRQEFVIGGYTKPSGKRVGFGALLLGYYADGELRYCGRVGTGFTADSLRELLAKMKSRRLESPPFVNPPHAARDRDVTWLRPELVAEVEFTEWTADDILRHPSFQGIREDKPANQVVREIPEIGANRAMSNGKAKNVSREKRAPPKRSRATAESRDNGETVKTVNEAIAGVTITHPDRILYPEQGITKQVLAEYYEQIADAILPYVADRPLTLVRCPDGRRGQCFYQKHLSGARPKGIRGVMVQEKEKREEYVVIDDLKGLVSLVQMGVLEIHPWPARADNVERPDRLVIDFDPGEGVAWKEVVQAAKEARDRLELLGLISFVRTTGGKGLHVVVPVSRRISWESFKLFAKDFADAMVRSAPDRYVATMSKAKRGGKIFIDYLRNQRGATAIANYSPRAREGAPVATPLTWKELSDRIKPTDFSINSLPKRLARLGQDPWQDFYSLSQSITADVRRKMKAL